MTRVGWCPGGRPVADMLATYPGTTVARIFVGPGDPLPAWDGPVLGPLVDQGVVVHLSYKTNTVAEVLAWARLKPAGLLLILTRWHEPEQQRDGDPTVERFHAGWAELVTAFGGHPMRPEILLGPVYTRYWWQRYAGDLRWLVRVPVDVIGWDVYSSGVLYQAPDDLLAIPRAVAQRTGLPYLVAELGARRVELDFDGAERSAWMRGMVAAARADGALTVCWYHREVYDLTRAGSEPEQQTWRTLIEERPMPTYVQLQAEPWWGREVTTPEMDWLGDELCRRAGRPRTAFGTKGDNHHLRGAHRSQEWLQRSVYCTNRTYTVQAGLTAEQLRHVAGADFTPGEWGTAGNRALMVEQTRRLVAAMRAGQLPGVREVIGTLDGKTVTGTRRDGSTFPADDSHLEHWHLTIDRRRCNDQALMERILRVALDATIGVAEMFCTYGDRGENVRALQFALNNIGFSVGAVDGIYGDATAAALRKAEASVGVTSDGKTYDADSYIRVQALFVKRFSAAQKGDPGPQGPAGPAGPQGPQGEPGTASDLTPEEVLAKLRDLLPGGAA